MFMVSRESDQSLIIGEFDGFERVLKIDVIAIEGTRVWLGVDLVSQGPVTPAAACRRLSKDVQSGRAESLEVPETFPGRTSGAD